MPPPLHARLSALMAEARQARVQGQDNGVFLALHGQRYVIKWAEVKPWARLRSWLAALVCWIALGERVAPAALRAGNIKDEAERLRLLLEAGRRVPPVYLQEDDGLILGWVGESLDTVLARLNPAEKIVLFTRVLDDLADWHAHGLWHGGAQLRNVTLYQDEIYRIDFEERHGMVLSPAAVRAYDLLLFLGDALSLLQDAHVMGEGCALLQRYLAQVAPEDCAPLQGKLKRLTRVLQLLVWVDRICPRLTHRRDKQRVVRFARVARAVLDGVSASG